MSYYAKQSIKHWAVEDRPREKLQSRGIDALTDAELIAILLGTGRRDASAIDLGREILVHGQSLKGLARMGIAELTQIRGIGPAKAITLMTAFELGRRKSSEESTDFRINSSASVAQYLQGKMADKEQEVFHVLFLNRNHEIKAERQMFQGGVSATIIDPRIVFREAVQHLASAIIVSHNHPSGNLTPSRADRQITQKLKEAGRLFDIPLLDHLIISHRGYYSFADEGEL
ncbi:MAG: DNA repair protein RadC [Bacteroidota bacterium]